MPDYPISEEALEAAAKAFEKCARASLRSAIPGNCMLPAINAFLAAEGFEVEENVLPTSYEKRLVGKWRPFEG